MVQRRRRHLVFMSSMGGKMPSTGLALYCATKFGLRGLGLALRQELAGSGVGVSVDFPGIIRDAGMWADSGLPTPKGVRSRSTKDVTRAVARAIERNRPEVDVAPPEMRVAAAISTAAPDLFARLGRRLCADEQAVMMAEAYRDRR